MDHGDSTLSAEPLENSMERHEELREKVSIGLLAFVGSLALISWLASL
jgi:hypothetical protein